MPRSIYADALCANPKCAFLAHDKDATTFGSFCCKKCHWISCTGSKTKAKHGTLCQKRHNVQSCTVRNSIVRPAEPIDSVGLDQPTHAIHKMHDPVLDDANGHLHGWDVNRYVTHDTQRGNWRRPCTAIENDHRRKAHQQEECKEFRPEDLPDDVSDDRHPQSRDHTCDAENTGGKHCGIRRPWRNAVRTSRTLMKKRKRRTVSSASSKRQVFYNTPEKSSRSKRLVSSASHSNWSWLTGTRWCEGMFIEYVVKACPAGSGGFISEKWENQRQKHNSRIHVDRRSGFVYYGARNQWYLKTAGETKLIWARMPSGKVANIWNRHPSQIREPVIAGVGASLVSSTGTHVSVDGTNHDLQMDSMKIARRDDHKARTFRGFSSTSGLRNHVRGSARPRSAWARKARQKKQNSPSAQHLTKVRSKCQRSIASASSASARMAAQSSGRDRGRADVSSLKPPNAPPAPAPGPASGSPSPVVLAPTLPQTPELRLSSASAEGATDGAETTPRRSGALLSIPSGSPTHGSSWASHGSKLRPGSLRSDGTGATLLATPHRRRSVKMAPSADEEREGRGGGAGSEVPDSPHASNKPVGKKDEAEAGTCDGDEPEEDEDDEEEEEEEEECEKKEALSPTVQTHLQTSNKSEIQSNGRDTVGSDGAAAVTMRSSEEASASPKLATHESFISPQMVASRHSDVLLDNPSLYVPGTPALYYSDRQEAWFECVVMDSDDIGIKVNVCGCDRIVPQQELARRLKPAPGQKAFFYSDVCGEWLECVVIAPDGAGGIKVQPNGDARNLHTVQKRLLETHLKPLSSSYVSSQPVRKLLPPPPPPPVMCAPNGHVMTPSPSTTHAGCFVPENVRANSAQASHTVHKRKLEEDLIPLISSHVAAPPVRILLPPPPPAPPVTCAPNGHVMTASQSTTHAGRFVLKNQIGAGQFGKVFKAVDPSSGNIYAIKQIKKKWERAVMVDFLALKSLCHPHVLRAIEHFEEHQYLNFVSEYVPGGSLAAYLHTRSKNNKPFTESWAAGVLMQVLDAMSYCHNASVVHNDLKPDNVLMKDWFLPESFEADPFPHVVVSDFGQASPLQLTQCPPCAGDPRYLPPEAWDGTVFHGVGSIAGDVWMIGCTLFEILSGGLLPFICDKLDKLISTSDFLSRHLSPSWVMHLNSGQPFWDATQVAGRPRSDVALACCATMLAKRPDLRPSCSLALQHQWCVVCSRLNSPATVGNNALVASLGNASASTPMLPVAVKNLPLDGGPEEYLLLLRKCLLSPADLREQASKHFQVFGSPPMIWGWQVKQSFYHTQTRLGRSIGPDEISCVTSLIEKQAGTQNVDQANFCRDGFEHLYLNMILTLAPLLTWNTEHYMLCTETMNMSFEDCSPAGYFKRLRCCLVSPNLLKMQVDKHATVFGNASGIIDCQILVRIWLHIHDRLQNPFGTPESTLPGLRKLLINLYGTLRHLVFTGTSFELVYWHMLHTILPFSLGCTRFAHSSISERLPPLQHGEHLPCPLQPGQDANKRHRSSRSLPRQQNIELKPQPHHELVLHSQHDVCFDQEVLRLVPSYWCNSSLAPGCKRFASEGVRSCLSQLFQSPVGDYCRNLGCRKEEPLRRWRVREAWRIENAWQFKIYCHKKLELAARIRRYNLKLEVLQKQVTSLGSGFGESLDSSLNEVYLLHGCSPDAASTIIQGGLDERISSQKGLYGSGIYLTSQPCKAMQYARANNCSIYKKACKNFWCTCDGPRTMLVVRVLLADVLHPNPTQQLTGMRRAPLVPGLESEGVTFSSVVALPGVANSGKQEHLEAVIFSGAQCYVEYMLELEHI